MNIIVTGGSGFIGQELIALLSLKHRVINIDMVPSELDVYEIIHDLTTGPVDLEADFCFHLASATGGILFNQQEGSIGYNAKLNKNTLATCGQIPIVFVSTLNVYEGVKSVHERPLKPSTPYAKSKLHGELYFLENANKLSIVRPCNIFGKSQISRFSQYGESHVIPDILHKIKNAETAIEVCGDGSQRRGFLHVSDMCNFLVSLLAEEKLMDYNICSNMIMSISELIDKLMKFAEKEVEIEYNNSYMKYEKMFISDISDELTNIGSSVHSVLEGIIQ